MHPSRGGYREPVTSKGSDGYQPQLTPRNLDRILAKGHSSTDLILTEARLRHLGFRSVLHPVKGSGVGSRPRLESSGDRSAMGG
jgi:hypothetical protein